MIAASEVDRLVKRARSERTSARVERVLDQLAAALEQLAAARDQAVWDALNEAYERVARVAGPYQSAGWNDAAAKAARAVAELRDERTP